MSGNKSKIIAFNYFGGKFTYLDELYAAFPKEFIHLIDVFAGSFVVSLNYQGKCIKTANDINSDITNFFKVLRDHTPELIRLLELTPCSNEEYDSCWEISENSIEQARRFYVRVRQSFFGLGAQRKNKGFHMAKSQLNAHRGETVSRWNNAIEKLYEVASFIRNDFQILNFDFEQCIRKTDTSKSFFYVDPPYDNSTRASKNDYKFEMSNDDRYRLASVLHNIKGKAMISGYSGGITEDLYRDWNMIKLSIKRNNIRSLLRKKNGIIQNQECIWMNYEPYQGSQLELLLR